MLIRLIRNQPKGSAITGRLVINGRFFCNTLERVGYQIPALCYPVRVTMSPRFKRLLPIVQNVPQRSGIRIHRGSKAEHSSGCVLVVGDNKNDNTDNLRPNQYSLGAHGENNHSRGRDILISLRSNDRLCRTIASGTLSPLSSNNNSPLSSNNNSPLSSKHIPVGARSAADVETQLTQLLLQTQNAHEEIILEVTDFRSGTELGYNTPCPPELQKP